MSIKVTTEIISEIEKLKNNTSEDPNNLYTLTQEGVTEIIESLVEGVNIREQLKQEVYTDIYNRIAELQEPTQFYQWVKTLIAEHIDIKPIAKNSKAGSSKAWLVGAAAVVIIALVCVGGFLGMKKHQETVRVSNLAKANELLKECAELEDAWEKADEEPDMVKLEEMYQQIIALGSPDGYYEMGTIYESEESGKQDYDKAYEYYQQAADLGSANGYYGIGKLYYYGNHFEKDVEKAKEYYEKAIELGSAQAAGTVGNNYYSGREGFEQSDEKAVEYWSKTIALCEQGDPTVDTSFYSSYLRGVGNSYATGTGVEQNTAYGLELMAKAGDLGDSIAANNLGWYYLVNYENIDVEQNVELGLKYANLAAELGDPYGYNAIAWYYHKEGDEEKCEEYLEKAISLESDNPELYYNIAGNLKSWEVYDKAIRYYEKAEELGSERAVNYQIGRCYEDMGDDDNALVYYLKSIEAQENLEGANYWNVAAIYTNRGDYEKAIPYFQKAGEAGSDNAINNMIGFCYGNLGNMDRAIEYMLKSVESGEDNGGTNYKNLGILYYRSKEYDKALEYLPKALELGHFDGAYLLAKCYRYGYGVEQDNAKALDYALKAQEMGCKYNDLEELINELKQMGN